MNPKPHRGGMGEEVGPRGSERMTRNEEGVSVVMGVGLGRWGLGRKSYLPHATAQKTGGVVKWAV